jgi:sigma-E factor negative regulatory protein RseA
MNPQYLPIPAEEMLSALADGELNAAECAEALSRASGDKAATQQWQTYHLIGNVLRAQSVEVAQAALSRDAAHAAAFTQRLSLRLAAESMSSDKTALHAVPAATKILADFDGKQAANDGNVRWKMLASVACLGTVAALAWNMLGSNGNDSASQLAQSAASQVVVASPQGPMVRDVRLEELLAAHKQMGGTSLPVPTGFLRNANLENQQAGRR